MGDCGCRAAPNEAQGVAYCPLHAAAPVLLERLQEWRRAPFFETETEWRAWVDDFGPRVDAAIAKATATEVTTDGEMVTCGLCGERLPLITPAMAARKGDDYHAAMATRQKHLNDVHRSATATEVTTTA